jgi:glutamine cyclotransferase
MCLPIKSILVLSMIPSHLKLLASFGYEGEGWGLTTDGKRLMMSNGSNTIQFRNPENFAVISTTCSS